MEVKTRLSPRQLLSALQKIENDLGRVRAVKNGPRTVDLDILLYGGLKLSQPDLTIPHPRMKERDFVLRPLREIAPLAVEKLLHENN
jgi:2-amino-4-hydroxy-6-hydroxymethyldihydropteridine diphosphokinase